MRLYSDLAQVYHEIYLRIFDYDKEFVFYDGMLKRAGCRRIRELVGQDMPILVPGVGSQGGDLKKVLSDEDVMVQFHRPTCSGVDCS